MKANFENLGAREIKRLASTIILLNETRDITNFKFEYDLHIDEIFISENTEGCCCFTTEDYNIGFNNHDNAEWI